MVNVKGFTHGVVVVVVLSGALGTLSSALRLTEATEITVSTTAGAIASTMNGAHAKWLVKSEPAIPPAY